MDNYFLIFITAEFVCPDCNKKYLYNNTLKRHRKYECQKEPQFFCLHCPYKAKQKCTLKAHTAIKHFHNEMPF